MVGLQNCISVRRTRLDYGACAEGVDPSDVGLRRVGHLREAAELWRHAEAKRQWRRAMPVASEEVVELIGVDRPGHASRTEGALPASAAQYAMLRHTQCAGHREMV